MPIRIVLVEPQHPGNIGAVARAMKNMGLRELHLVKPALFPHQEASARASGADDVLDAAVVHERFDQAIADCGLIVGTSARQRHLPWSIVEPRECSAQIIQSSRDQTAAVVFGAERIDSADLTVPHPGIAERGFVLAPLHDIAPTLSVPGVGRVETLLRALADDGIAEVLPA